MFIVLVIMAVIIRTPFLTQQYGEEMVTLFNEVKHILDPYNISNQGKKVNGSLKFAREHIAL
jgi:FAD/FMN-containing dehydrogenase